MKISIITVSYNSANTIRETFESVRSQREVDFDLEYIHIDGLSTDSTMEISLEFDDIVTIRISESDTGIYNAMNKGLGMATGDIIGFLNSDDTFYSKDTLSEVIRSFKLDKSLDIVYGDIEYVDNQGKVKRKWSSGNRRSFSDGWHPAHPGFFAKKSAYNKYGQFDEKLTIAADFDLMLRFLEVANLNAIYLNKILVRMKLGGESNKSLKNIFVANKQIIKSFTKYSIRPNRGYTLKRWAKKILESFI